MRKTILLNHSNWHFTKENPGIPTAIMGEAITLLAMVGCPLTKEEMVNVQKRIADKKEALRHEVIAENMQ